MSQYLVFICLATAFAQKPLYKYRYETEDVMKTAASSVPVHGYHVVEGGYYPQGYETGFSSHPSHDFGYQSGGINGHYTSIQQPIRHLQEPIGHLQGSIGHLQEPIGHLQEPIGHLQGSIGHLQGPIGHLQGPIGYHHGSVGQVQAPIHYAQPIVHQHHLGGKYVDKNVYEGANKKLNDEVYEKKSGSSHEEGNHGKEGYAQGKVALKNNKGDSGYYSDEVGAKKVVEDGKNYHGDQHFNKEGKNSDEKQSKSGHKKGHIIKGFKTSHHKDESGKTEEYYDEENDEGGNVNFSGQSGAFGQAAKSSYKGGHEDEKFNAEKKKTEGHYESDHIVDNSNADHGRYGEKKTFGSGQTFGSNNGVDQESILGHQESSKFYKHQPYHVPFYSHD